MLFNFNGTDGSNPGPYSALAFGSSGALYGTTTQGGSGDSGGTVYELAPPAAAGGTWAQTVLYSFRGYTGQRGPLGGVLIGPGGALYGTVTANAVVDSSTAGGAVFMLTPPATPGGTWTDSTLDSFIPRQAGSGRARNRDWFPPAGRCTERRNSPESRQAAERSIRSRRPRQPGAPGRERGSTNSEMVATRAHL